MSRSSDASGPDRLPAPMRIGEWHVDPALDQIARGDQIIKLEPRATRLLVLLAQRPAELFTTEEILATVWKDTIVTSSSIYEVVAQLRKALGDQADQPRYIATVSRKGYRLVAPVLPANATAGAPPPAKDAAVPTRPPGVRPPPPSPAAALQRLPNWAPATLILLAGVGLLWHNMGPNGVVESSTPEVVVKPAEVTARPANRTPRILWVDDKPSNNVREREALSALGVTFDLAESTDAGLRLLERSKYDLVISDMNRPGDTAAGYNLLRALRDRGDATRFVIYTGSCTEAQSQEARSRGALGCASQISQLMQLSIAALETRP